MHWLVVGTCVLWLAGPPAAPLDTRDPSVPLAVESAPDPREPSAPIDITPPTPDPREPSGPIDITPPPATDPPTDLSPKPASLTPTPDLSPKPATRPNPFASRFPGHPHRIGRLPGYIGLGAGVGLTSRSIGATDQRTAVTPYGAVHGRIAGYTQRKGRRDRKALVMILPELQLDLELGGTAAASPAAHGVMLGASGVFDIGIGFASPGSVGVYTYLRAAQRFRARLHTDLEGAHYLATPGITAGLRFNHAHKFTLLAGGGVDGSIGAQRFLRRSLVAQLAPVATLAIYSEPNDDLYIGLVGRFDVTALGHAYGGARMHGRATAEVMWRVRRIPHISLATLFLGYEGTRISAAPGHPQFDPLGERRTSHQLLLALGVTL